MIQTEREDPNQLVTTIHGPMERKFLVKKFVVTENDNQITEVTSYYWVGHEVHRSVHVRLKKGLGIEGILGRFGT